MKTVLLLNPPLYFDNGQPKSLDVSFPPLGLLYLASYINKNSSIFKAKIIDIGQEKKPLDDLIKAIKKTKPYVIGITSMTPQLQGATELAKQLKKHLKEIPIFLGGPHVSADPDFINRHSSLFDYAITGEGEITFLESLNKIYKNNKLPLTQKSTPPLKLDDLPYPDKTLIKRKNYKKTESMMFSRGCPFHCYYCSRPSISHLVRYRSSENLIAEIKSCYPYCHGDISFQDDTFTMNSKNVIDFCKKIIKQKLKISWDCNTRIDLVDKKILTLMKKAGCRQINFGIESGNERVRKEIIHKGNFTNKDIKKVFDYCKNLKIKIACYFMIGHPTETKKELNDTKKMILNSKIDILGLSIPTPFPGSALYDISLKEGIISPKIIDNFSQKKLGVGYSGIYPVYIPKQLGREYLYGFLKQVNRKFYLNAKTIFNRLLKDLISPKQLKNDFKDFISLIINGVSSRKPYIKK
ncbi:MAG TPA: radical SAM protein [Candidatus Woesebacteria bacterium]|nr:radical SAM protein [Candidatus Woesebacteria bacterium]